MNKHDEVSSLANIHKRKRKEIQKTGLIYKLGNASDKTISFIAMVAVSFVLFEPLFMFFYTFHGENIDVFLLESTYIVEGWVFPLASVVTLPLYILVLLRIRNENKGLAYNLKKNPLFIIFSITVMLMFVSQFYNMNNGWNASFFDTPDFIRAESFVMQYSYFVVLLFAGSQVRLEKHKKFLLRSQLIISVLVVVCAFIYWKSDAPSFIFSGFEWGFTAFFNNRNYYGYYLAVFTPLSGAMFVYDKNMVWKVMALVSFIANTIGLALNDCTGAWAGAFFAIIFIIITHLIIEKKVNIEALILLPLFIISLYITGHINGTFEANMSVFGSDIIKIATNADGAEAAGSGRIQLWTAAIDVIKGDPLFGIGFEGVYVREYVGAPYMTRPHNEFLQYAMFYGIPMAVMYFAGCIGIFIRALRKKKYLDGATLACLTAAFGYLVSSFFGLTVHSTTMFLFVFMGMGYVRKPEETLGEETVKNGDMGCDNIGLDHIGQNI